MILSVVCRTPDKKSISINGITPNEYTWMETMSVRLPRELEDLIQKKVESGQYDSPYEVVREALQLLDDRDKLREIRLEELRREIQIGIDQADRGELLDGPEAIDRIREKIRAKLSSNRSS
ncbi:hypothetical protein BH23PLA1_BH23PLA1_10180 [soil metagenome]